MRGHRLQLALAFAGVTFAVRPGVAADGTGSVYIPNSIDNPVVQMVTLPDLDASGNLIGIAVDVTHAFTSTYPRAFDAGLVFNYTPPPATPQGGFVIPPEDEVHFAETMAYYHIATYDAYVASLGYGAAPAPVPVIVFNGTFDATFGLWTPIPSQYLPATGAISLGMRDVDTTDAHDADIILHEYAHAIQHRLMGGVAGVFVKPESDMADQGQALMEGLADYAAGSWFGDPEIGEWFGVIHFPSAFRPYARTIENFRRWPADFGANEQLSGMIFSGAMWDLRSVVGAAVVDPLWLGLVAGLVDNDGGATPELNTTYDEALTTLLGLAAGDAVLQDRISQAFGARGIGIYDFTTPFPMVRDPGNNYDATQTYTIPGASALTVQFDEFISRLDNSVYTSDEFQSAPEVDKFTVDQLEILDGNDVVIGTYTGRQLQGLQVIVPGDTAKFHLTTDASLAPFGYRVTDISPCASLDLNVAPGSDVVAPGDVVTVTLDVSNLPAAINGAQALIRYDNTILTLTGITENAGQGWSVLTNTDNAGDITYIVSILAGSTAVDHTIATLTFQAIAEGTTNLTFWSGALVNKLTRASDSTPILPCLGPSGNIVSACDDGQFCNGVETFVASACQAGIAPDCSAFTDQCNNGACNEALDICEAQPLTDGTACVGNGVGDCTAADTCQAGVCLDNDVADGPAGAGLCDDLNDCTQDNCLAGACSNPNESAGTSCAGNGVGDCTAADTCDGAGVCLDNDLSDGPAGAGLCDDLNDCTQDNCLAGACSNPNESAGTSCAGNGVGDCTAADTCDGAGVCLDNDLSDGPAGAGLCDDLNDCTQDNCLAGACSNPNESVGTSCTGNGVGDCTAADTCDGAGVCLDNDAVNGPTGAGLCDDLNDCTQNNCLAGACDNPNELDGTSCDDADVCTENDVCATGVCTGVNVPRVTVNVEIDALDPAAITRDVTFRLTECAGPTVETRVDPVTFVNRTGTAVLDNINPAAEWINVREGHTLAQLAGLAFDACNHATVDLTGANRLVSGDFHTAVVGQDALVDVTDLSILSTGWMTPIAATSSMGADATGDGQQDTADHSALVVNATKSGAALDGCPGGRPSGIVPPSASTAPNPLCDGDETATAAQVEITLGSRPRTIDIGAQFEMNLVVASTDPFGADVALSAMDVLVTWDPSAIGLLSVNDTSSYDWLLASPTKMTLPDPLNASFLDGDLRFTALARLGAAAHATTDGLTMATLRFLALSPAADTGVSLAPDLGESAETRVFGAECANQRLAHALRSAGVSVVAPQDCEGDGISDLREFYHLQSCYTGPVTPPDPDGLPAYPVAPERCCSVFDRDDDGDVDEADYAYFADLMRNP